MKPIRRPFREAIEKLKMFGLAPRVDSIVFIEIDGVRCCEASDLSFGVLLTDPRNRAAILRWTLLPGGEISSHWHPCQEDVVVISGKLEDRSGNVLRSGDHVSYAPSEEHGFRAVKESVFLKVFQPGMEVVDKMNGR